MDKQPAPPGFPRLPWRVDGRWIIIDATGDEIANTHGSAFSSKQDALNAEAIVTAVNAYYRNADEQESAE